MTTRDDGTIEVTPVTLSDESDVSPISGADAWIADITERASGIAAKYRPHEIDDEADYRRSTTDRAAARRELKAIDDDRKRMTASIKEALSDFETRAREATEPLRSIDAGYKAAIDAYKEHLVTARLADMRAAWEATEASRAVTFDTLERRYAASEGWRAKSMADAKARRIVRTHADAVTRDLATIDALPDDLKGPTYASYVHSLDLTAAMAKAQEQVALARRREEGARRAREGAQEQSPQPSPTRTEATTPPVRPVARPALRTPCQQAPIPGATTGTWQQPTRPAQQTAPTPDGSSMSWQATPQSRDVPKPYRIDTEPLTRDRLAQVMDTLHGLGVRATARPLY